MSEALHEENKTLREELRATMEKFDAIKAKLETAEVTITHREEDIERLKRLNATLGRLPACLRTLLDSKELVAHTLTSDCPEIALELLARLKSDRDVMMKQEATMAEMRERLT